jgi:hypothetical protein
MSVVIRYHCDQCGKFISKSEVMIREDRLTGKKMHYCHECYHELFIGAPVYTQQSLKVF